MPEPLEAGLSRKERASQQGSVGLEEKQYPVGTAVSLCGMQVTGEEQSQPLRQNTDPRWSGDRKSSSRVLKLNPVYTNTHPL